MSFRHLLSSLALTVLLVGSASSANAQIFSRGDLFGPGALPPMFSIEGAFGQHVQSGEYQAACNCTFTGQTAGGFLANLMYELPIDYTWVIGIKAGIDFKGLKGSELFREDAVITHRDRQDSLSLDDALFDRTAKVDLTYLGVTPFVKYQFARVGPFVQLGPNIQFLVSSHFLHRRELLTNTYEREDGTTVPIRFNNNEQFEVLQDEEIATANGLRLSLQVTGGWDFELSDHSLIAPMVTYEFPFTTVRDDAASDWKITSLYGSIAIKFRMD